MLIVGLEHWIPNEMGVAKDSLWYCRNARSSRSGRAYRGSAMATIAIGLGPSSVVLPGRAKHSRVGVAPARREAIHLVWCSRREVFLERPAQCGGQAPEKTGWFACSLPW